MRRHMNRQADALAVILLALIAVILYTVWGSSVLRAEKQAGSMGTAVVAAR